MSENQVINFKNLFINVSFIVALFSLHSIISIDSLITIIYNGNNTITHCDNDIITSGLQRHSIINIAAVAHAMIQIGLLCTNKYQKYWNSLTIILIPACLMIFSLSPGPCLPTLYTYYDLSSYCKNWYASNYLSVVWNVIIKNVILAWITISIYAILIGVLLYNIAKEKMRSYNHITNLNLERNQMQTI